VQHGFQLWRANAADCGAACVDVSWSHFFLCVSGRDQALQCAATRCTMHEARACKDAALSGDYFAGTRQAALDAHSSP
jgi:hypothetical protein